MLETPVPAGITNNKPAPVSVKPTRPSGNGGSGVHWKAILVLVVILALLTLGVVWLINLLVVESDPNTSLPKQTTSSAKKATESGQKATESATSSAD
jgi:hypothetical protein